MQIEKALAKNATKLIAEKLPELALTETQKTGIEEAIRETGYSLHRDRWVYRIAISILGLTILSVVGGGLYLAGLNMSGSSFSLPESIVALGATAIGALAGLFARPPDP